MMQISSAALRMLADSWALFVIQHGCLPPEFDWPCASPPNVVVTNHTDGTVDVVARLCLRPVPRAD